MSKRDSAPTHGWVIASQLNKWLARLFLVFLILAVSATYDVYATMRKDCRDYHRTWSVGSRTFDVNVHDSALVCGG